MTSVSRQVRLWCGALLVGSGTVAACSNTELYGILANGPSDSTDASTSGATSGSAIGTGDAGSGAASGGSGSSGASAVTAGPKRGLAYGYNSLSDLSSLNNFSMMGGVHWWQNWTSFPDKSLDGGAYETTGVEYVPTIWGSDFDAGTVESQIPGDAKYLLTFNLPNTFEDSSGTFQSGIPVAQAVGLWPGIEQIAHARNLKIVSPSVDYCYPDAGAQAQCIEPDPFAWLSDFIAACPTCEFDYVGVSSRRCLAGDLMQDIAKYEKMFNKPIWLTSFGCSDPTIDVATFMSDAVTSLELDPMVFRYGWFTGYADAGAGVPTSDSLLAAPGSSSLTPLGMEYVGLVVQ
jgi:hypothetical protein